jgi:hypothetical protein
LPLICGSTLTVATGFIVPLEETVRSKVPRLMPVNSYEAEPFFFGEHEVKAATGSSKNIRENTLNLFFIVYILTNFSLKGNYEQ